MLMSATMELLRHGGIGGEVLRSEQTLFFRGDEDEQHRALQLGLRMLQRVGDVEHQRRSRAVVHGAVVNAIAIDGLADAEVVHVGREHDVLVLQLGIGAGQLGNDVVRFDVFLDDLGARLDAGGQREARQVLRSFARSASC